MSDSKMISIAIIGAGNMGAAIARGLAAAKGGDKTNICVSNPSPAKLAPLAQLGIRTVSDNREAVGPETDIIILAVKPRIVPEVLAELHESIDFGHTLVASLAATISLEELRAMCAPEARVARIMPNTAISIGESMTFVCSTDSEAASTLSTLLAPMGKAEVVEERLFPALTSLCSCGIAYALRYIRAAVEGAVELGIHPSEATTYVAQTIVGAAALASAPGAHPEAEIDKVTTPGGLTIRGLNAMEAAGFSASVIAGLKEGAR